MDGSRRDESRRTRFGHREVGMLRTAPARDGPTRLRERRDESLRAHSRNLPDAGPCRRRLVAGSDCVRQADTRVRNAGERFIASTSVPAFWLRDQLRRLSRVTDAATSQLLVDAAIDRVRAETAFPAAAPAIAGRHEPPTGSRRSRRTNRRERFGLR